MSNRCRIDPWGGEGEADSRVRSGVLCLHPLQLYLGCRRMCFWKGFSNISLQVVVCHSENYIKVSCALSNTNLKRSITSTGMLQLEDGYVPLAVWFASWCVYAWWWASAEGLNPISYTAQNAGDGPSPRRKENTAWSYWGSLMPCHKKMNSTSLSIAMWGRRPETCLFATCRIVLGFSFEFTCFCSPTL